MKRLSVIAAATLFLACSSDDTTGQTDAGSSGTTGSSGGSSGTARNCDLDAGTSGCGADQVCAVADEANRLPICYVIAPCGSETCASDRCGQACEKSPCDAKLECLK